MKFRPCIDIHQGKVKQIVGSTLTDAGAQENFVTERSAAEFAEMYKQDGLTGGHMIMLDPEAGTIEQAVGALQAYAGGLQIGGGINPENADYFLNHGASHVIVTSYVFKDGQINFDNLAKLVQAVGKERLVLDLSCRKKDGTYFVATDRWQKWTDFEITFDNLQLLSEHCTEFLIHGADVEGKREGIEKDLVRKLGEWASLPITYAGGVKSMSDLTLVKMLGQGRVDLTIGSGLDIFGGDIPYQGVVDWHREQNS